MSATTYGDISQRTAAWAADQMLRHAEPVNILQKFGQSKPIPKNKAELVKFRRAVPFAPATVPLAEGVTPSSHKLSYEDVPVTLKQWGDLAELTDKVHDLAEDPVLKDMTYETGLQIGATMEQVTYGVIKAGTSVFYANGANRAAVNSAITLNKQRAVTRYLEAQKARKFSRVLSGSTMLDTHPIEAAYIAVCHTDCSADIRNLAGFVPTAKYGNRQTICDEELGSVDNVRYVVSPDLAPFTDAGGTPGSTVVSTGGSAADVYPILFLGMEAYGLCPLKGAQAVQPSVINPGTIDKSDPLGQRGFVGWKAWFNAVRLNETWMARLEVGVTKL
jgi:N4-gp56 family major capsid protein